MKVQFLTQEQYENLLASNKKDKIFRAVHFSHSLDKSDDFLGIASVVPLDEKEYEVWIADEPVAETEIEGVPVTTSGDLMYARFEADEVSSLEHTTFELYAKIFSVINSSDAHMVRIWNYIPRILDHNDSLERYRQFNMGRRRAWEKFTATKKGLATPPAASGIGALGGPLKIGVIFSKVEPVHIQNPRQINSFEYSDKYGPKPPSFSRATYLPGTGLFISGTASITQEDSVHIGDPIQQTIETMRNIEALLFDENLDAYDISEEYSIDQITDWRLYIKHAYQRDFIIEAFNNNRGNNHADFVSLHDDICRKDLLIEIEGMILN